MDMQARGSNKDAAPSGTSLVALAASPSFIGYTLYLAGATAALSFLLVPTLYKRQDGCESWSPSSLGNLLGTFASNSLRNHFKLLSSTLLAFNHDIIYLHRAFVLRARR